MTSRYSITVERKFNFLSKDYKVLFESSGATRFQAPLWLDHIHRILVRGLDARQHTIVIRNLKDNVQNGALLAVFPFVIQKALPGMQIMQFADFGISDYNAVVGNNAVLTRLADDKTVRDHLENIIKETDLLLVRKMREDSFDISLFFRKMARTSNDNSAFHCEPCNDVTVWEKKTFSKKFLKNLRRNERNFTRDHSAYEFRKPESPDEIQTILSTVQQIQGVHFKDSLLQGDIYLQFYVEYAIAAIAAGEAAIFALYLDNRMIACEFGLLKDNGFICILAAAYIDDYPVYSLGHQVFYKLCHALVSDGKSHIDLGIGSYDYKKRFGVRETRLYNYSLAISFSGNAVAATYNYAKPLKNILKKYVPHVR